MNNPMTATFVQPLAMPKALSVKEDKKPTMAELFSRIARAQRSIDSQTGQP